MKLRQHLDDAFYQKAIDSIAEQIRNDIDHEILGKLEDMLKCTVHKIVNCDSVICKQELQERTDAWDVEEVLLK